MRATGGADEGGGVSDGDARDARESETAGHADEERAGRDQAGRNAAEVSERDAGAHAEYALPGPEFAPGQRGRTTPSGRHPEQDGVAGTERLRTGTAGETEAESDAEEEQR